ncbi:pyridoxamine 5'-phosphate oxidase family protein [Corallococcus sp. BB11-1]|uniref:pyridoxamine 5'-phosphate oxidase family protein n=1 Tax=Corallococcus sp. BB11-1 TaxID=2996783 RepID=UPI002270EF33|nr:pyridoxamine 5'-phosphate oxidase family protein [Corallococcus sp. BB11-1]MCY1035566.1 pyridoxamine 5'-phosphate oxidase family protein [Corallococcus sp. BB11-1]
MSQVQSVEALERLVGSRPLGVMMKSLEALDAHCVRLLSLSSFAVLGFIDEEGRARLSSVGGPRGFATVVDSTHLRFELHEPLSLNPTVGCGLLFLIPGLGETLRVNGHATLDGNTLLVTVEETFVHCAKALMRSAFWKPPVSVVPTSLGPVAPGPLSDPAVRDWLSRVPFVVVASWDAQGHADVSPKGDPPGFLRLDGARVAVADRPGNRRTDTFHNLLEQPRVAVLALVPGEGRELELSGVASLTTDPALLASMEVAAKVPKVALSLEPHQARLRASPAVLHAGLWDASRHVPPDQLPRMADVFIDHVRQNPQRGAAAATLRALASKRMMSWALTQDYKRNLY